MPRIRPGPGNITLNKAGQIQGEALVGQSAAVVVGIVGDLFVLPYFQLPAVSADGNLKIDLHQECPWLASDSLGELHRETQVRVLPPVPAAQTSDCP